MKLEDIYKKSQYTRISRQLYRNPEQSIGNTNGLQSMIIKGTIEIPTKYYPIYGTSKYGEIFYGEFNNNI